MAQTLAFLLFFALVAALEAGEQTISGKIGTFGGPDDKSIGPDEDLAIYGSASQRSSIFLDYQPEGTTGLVRRLNPERYYIAMRWDYTKTPIGFLRRNHVTVKNVRNGRSASAWPADWGPDRTDRIADLSPGLARDLGLKADDRATFIVPLP